MNKHISSTEAQSKLSEKLIGSSINRVTYDITSWEMRFIGTSSEEHILIASEISSTRLSDWWDSLGNMPVDLRDTNEADDTISAINIFTVLNRWPVTDLIIDERGNLELVFENRIQLIMPAVVDLVDWTWQFNTEDGANIITCDSGKLYGNPNHFKN
ncbi:hypothetical protein P4E94_19280 [Pontiellaceae bacterium B12219]|nr:hypothetical protein [Pontiellaceae bacterium B12219]